MSTSLRTPFQTDGGRIATTTDQHTQVEQKIIDVAVTQTLERPARPGYGGNIMSLLFENTSATTLEFADYRTELGSAIAENVTGVRIHDIQANMVDQYLVVTISYSLPLSSVRQFTFRLAEPGSLDSETPLT